MTEIILKTGWKHWDMYLSKFVGKKINCLDIGSYTGESTCWMLNNLCTNPYSRVFSVDTWEGSPEYGNYTNEIEKKFDEAIEKTGKKDQYVKMKMISSKALIKLKEFGFIIFDFIFIDASHEAKDVITDAILSWDILNEEGILIFDDYKWDKLKGEEFRPKLAIDSFVAMFKPQLKTLYSGYQYIIEKIKLRDYDKPELEDYYKLVGQINNLKFINFEYVLDDNIIDDINFNLYFDINKKQFINTLDQDIYYKEKLFKYDKLFNSISDNLLIKYNINYKIFATILKLNIFKLLLDNTIKKIFINDSSITNDNFSLLYNLLNTNNKLKVSFNNILIFNQKSYTELIKTNNKYDLIYIGHSGIEYDKTLYNETLYHKYIIFMIGILLNIQESHGNTCIRIVINIRLEFLINIIYLLKKYYNKIIIKNKYTNIIGSHIYILCYDYKTINNNELNNINKIILDILNNNKTIISLYNTDNKLYINYIDKITYFYNLKHNDINKHILLYKKIIKYIDNNVNNRYINNIKINLYKNNILNNIYIAELFYNNNI
jgi:predicted O-methyltransferase YrrM